MDRNDILQMRLDQNHRDYVAQLQSKTAEELIALAPEIVAAQQLRDELAAACSEEDAAALLQFDDCLTRNAADAATRTPCFLWTMGSRARP